MKIHEYQGKQLFAKAGVATPKGIVARHPMKPPPRSRNWVARSPW